MTILLPFFIGSVLLFYPEYPVEFMGKFSLENIRKTNELKCKHLMCDSAEIYRDLRVRIAYSL